MRRFGTRFDIGSPPRRLRNKAYKTPAGLSGGRCSFDVFASKLSDEMVKFSPELKIICRARSVECLVKVQFYFLTSYPMLLSGLYASDANNVQSKAN